MHSKKDTTAIPRRKFVKTSLAAGAAAATAIGAPAVLRAQKTTTLKYVTFASKNSVWAKPYFFLAEEVEKRSNGELKIQYTGGSEVIGGFQAPEAVSKGVFDISHSANSYFASAMRSSISLASGKASRASLEKAGVIKAYNEILGEKLNVTLLGIPMSDVSYVFMTNGPPKTLSYFKGRKIRSIALYDPILRSLGAATVTTPPAEAYTALERGVVDGLGWPDIGLFDYKFHEHARYVMSPSFYTLRTCTLMNKNSFAKLPGALQKVLVESAKAADDRGGAWCKETSKAERAKMASAGLTEVALSKKEAAEFLALTEDKLWEKVEKDAPKDAARLRPLYEKAADLG